MSKLINIGYMMIPIHTEGINIGQDCEDIINDYLNQLIMTEKYDCVMKELLDTTHYKYYSERFSGINSVLGILNYYHTNLRELMVIRNKNQTKRFGVEIGDIEIISLLP